MALAILSLGLPATASAATTPGSATLAWDENSEPDVTGYKIHWGEVSQTYTQVQDVGDAQVAILGNLNPGQEYFCAVTAYNAAGLESPYSAEITVLFGTAPEEPDTSGRLVRLEAENGQLGSPMTVFNGSAESWVDTATYSQAGWTKLTFDAPVAGDYQVWCRVKAPTAGTDSFFVMMDNGAEEVFHVYGTPTPPEGTRTSDWTWRRVHVPDAGPRSHTLDQASHSLRFRVREPGTLLDRVVLSSDPAFVPSDSLPWTGDALAVTGNPASQSAGTGGSVTFVVTAAATGPVSYQWKKNGVAIPGATSPSLTLEALQIPDGGSYSVALASGAAAATAGPAVLTVVEPGNAPVFQVNRMTVNPAHSLTFEVSGELNNELLVYASSDLLAWTLIGSQMNETGSISATDPGAAGQTRRYYRLVSEAGGE